MKRLRLISAIAAAFIFTSLCACTGGNIQGEAPTLSAQSETPPALPDASPNPADITEPDALGEVTISFDYEKQSGYASNQFAVWVEDAGGDFIKTLYATRFTANGGYKNRPDSISAWVGKSGIADMTKTDVDAITGATPKAGTLSYTWDLTDANGKAVSPGEYKFFVEGSLRWKNRVIYSGVIEVGSNPATVQADSEFIYEAADNQPALTSASPENSMIGAVTASFVPTAVN